MTVNADSLTRLAQLLADRTRMTLLLALLDGRAWTMGELARHARVSGSTASEQLSRLVGAGLLVEERQGRHRYLRLADRQVARLIEDLAEHANRPDGGSAMTGAPASGAPTSGAAASGAAIVGGTSTGPGGLRAVKASQALAAGRTCYDHLAGRLGVAITDAMAERGLIDLTDGVSLTPAGADRLGDLGIDLARLRASRRPLIRTCLDWTERRPHLAGGVGAAIRDIFLANAWVQPGRMPRVMLVTDLGRRELAAQFGLDLSTETLRPVPGVGLGH